MNALGRFGEDHAARWLQESGCTVLERGRRFGHGEIDLIILDEEDLAFVEVKTRSPDYLVRPAEAVGPAKRRKLIETALYYTMEHPEYSGYQPRFDVMEIVAQPADGSWSILEQAYWKGAFDVNGSL